MVWVKIRTDILLVLFWPKDYQQKAMVATSKKKVLINLVFDINHARVKL